MSDLAFVVAIPARHGSTRLPGKPLRLIAGVPMVVHVARSAMAAGALQVVIATDDERIAEAVSGYPLTVCMTRRDHVSGTDRLAECASVLGWPADRIIVNLQGDEPFAPPEGIRAVAQTLADSDVQMATLAIAFDDCESMFTPDVVKVVRDANGMALYFSRAPIPWQRDRFESDRISALSPAALRHIGIYAYRAGFLAKFAQLPPGLLERSENLEQLRILETGYRIAVGLSPVPFPPGVDTECDLLRAEAWMQR